MARAKSWPSWAALGRAWSAVTVFDIPIYVDRSWFIIAALLMWSLSTNYFPTRAPGLSWWSYWLMGGSATLLLYVCIVLHEFGHSLVARQHGIRVACVTLFIFGGVSQILDHPRRPSVELRVAIAGPLVNIFLAVLFSFMLKGGFSPADRQVLQMAVDINLVLALFNMIPIPPLDGSRVVMGLLPSSLAYLYGRLEQYGIVIVFVLLYFGILNRVIWPIVEFFKNLLGMNT